MTEQKPISPQEAKEWYLENRRADIAEATYTAHQYRLSAFVEWCEINDIENMNNISGRHFHKYKTWRREEGDCNKVTLATQLSTLKVFINFCEGIDAVQKGLSEYIDPPTMSKQEDVNDDHLDVETAEVIIEHNRKYNYSQRNHVIFELLWHTGMRNGALRSIDLRDFDAENGCIEVVHRPEEDTPIKNKTEGQRIVALKPKVNSIVSDYVDHNRISKTDEYGREPLITTRQGRISKGAIRTACYHLTLPCTYGMGCPHRRDTADCEALKTHHSASKCPSSHASHSLRKGAITHARRQDVPLEAVSERMDVSADILKKHYDKRTKKEQMKTRRGYFDSI
ncbi:XerD/XerC family integrase [Halapricum desulfuricans]|uniref:XerD/XerC family integrase n=1 Tax=Halapricum desulfuricans TaxID=2841257 RepID=A0A897NIM8_9EURY|nr:tyrosine-type recombinase/integrase [Halapricum desulfuricans]QSG10739.1 XerD/XerC family integrase [Halapricum desulfuricans]